MKARLPEYRMVVAKLVGAPYSSHSLYLGNQCIYSCLSPMSEDEIHDRIRAHLAPTATPAARIVRATPGRKPKSQGDNSPAWRTPPEDE